jgi:hypothetical protein
MSTRSAAEWTSMENKTNQIPDPSKRLELMMGRLDLQHQAVQTELEWTTKVLQKNIEIAFACSC